MENGNLNTPQNPPLQQTAVRRIASRWTQEEVDWLMHYEFADDSETIEERLEFARYMLHYENGSGFPERSLSAVKHKFYEEVKRRRAS